MSPVKVRPDWLPIYNGQNKIIGPFHIYQGSHWLDQDKREPGRVFTVERTDDQYAYGTTVKNDGASPKPTRIRLDKFGKTWKGCYADGTAPKRRHYSGICVCKHHSEEHHGNMVMNIDYVNATGESRIAGECEHYGWNECTDRHCGMFHDKDDPEPDKDADRRPNPPSDKVGGCDD